MYKQRLIVFFAVSLAVAAAVVQLRPAERVPVATGAEFWAAKTQTGDASYDVVVVGDSRSLMGVSPAAMRKVLPGREILNFGYLGAGLTPDFISAAVRKIDPDSRDRLLVVSVTPLSLSSRALANEHFEQESKRPRSEPLRPRYSRYSDGIRRAFEPFQLFAPKRATPRSESAFREAGWFASKDPATGPELQLMSYTRHFARGTFDDPNFERLLETLARTTASGVKILAFRHPSSPKMEALEDRLSGFRVGYVRKRLADAGVTWLSFKSSDGRNLEFASYDGSHLMPKGAVAFSAVLAEKIAERE